MRHSFGHCQAAAASSSSLSPLPRRAVAESFIKLWKVIQVQGHLPWLSPDEPSPAQQRLGDFRALCAHFNRKSREQKGTSSSGQTIKPSKTCNVSQGHSVLARCSVLLFGSPAPVEFVSTLSSKLQWQVALGGMVGPGGPGKSGCVHLKLTGIRRHSKPSR